MSLELAKHGPVVAIGAVLDKHDDEQLEKPTDAEKPYQDYDDSVDEVSEM